MEDKKHAQLSGPCVPLGFSDTSFYRALDKQPPHGSCFFDAFVIGKEVKTIEHIACASDTENTEKKNYT